MGKLKALTATDTIVIVAEDSHADVAAAARALLPLGTSAEGGCHEPELHGR